MGGGPTPFINERVLRKAELDGTQAIADAIAPAPDETVLQFNGVRVVPDPSCPTGTLYFLPGE